MFTRHFYEVDEVLQAMEWCIKRGRIKEAVFWCSELLESELQEMALEKLRDIWLWHFGLGSLSAILLLKTLETEEELLQFVCGLCSLPKESRDRSLLVLLLFGSLDTTEPDRASVFPCLETLFQQFQCSDLEQAFLRSVYQGKTRLAFDLSRPLWQENPSRVFTLLQEIQTRKQNNESLKECLELFEIYNQWPMRACAVATVCLDSKRLKQSFSSLRLNIPLEIQEARNEWKALSGRRKRRIYEIPYECLYMITERGKMSNKETNLKKIHRLNETTLEGSPFWDRVLEEEVPWLDDERKEAFYDLYFPDDIPDEWSKADQEKSHGYGVLIHQEPLRYSKYTNRWFRDISSRGYWLTNDELQKICDRKEQPCWETLFDQPWSTTVSTWCLTPVKKRILIVDEPVTI